ncbi:hypothetical protein [Enterococcus casseliflavus]|nr:hypothetical protein [Enterococcus casseliflavus]
MQRPIGSKPVGFLRSSKKWYTVTETAAQRRQHISSCAAKNGFHEVKT